MQTDNYIISLDVGTQYIKASALSVNDQSVIYGALEQSLGITKDGMINPAELGGAIRNVINKLELKLERKIQSCYVSMPNEYTRLMSTEGHCIVMGVDVTSKELNETKESAKRVFHQQDEEVVDLIVSKYSLDDTLYSDPCGVKGDRLSLYGQVVLGKKEILIGLIQAMEVASVKISGFVLASEAAASLLLTKKDLREGVVLVDVGASTTRITLYGHQKIKDFKSINLGGKNITKDISIVMKMSLLEAEEMKVAYGKGERNLSDEDASLLEEIIKARVNEIIGYVDTFVMKHDNFAFEKVIYYGGGLCGFINVLNLHKTSLKQSTNFMTSDIIRDDTVLHILSGGVAYRLLSSMQCLDKKMSFSNLVEEDQEKSILPHDKMGNRDKNDGDEKLKETTYGLEYDEDDEGNEDYTENKIITWIKNLWKKFKNN